MVKIVLKSVQCISIDGGVNIVLYAGLDDDVECLKFAKNLYPSAKSHEILSTTTFTQLKSFFDISNWPEFLKNHDGDYFSKNDELMATSVVKNMAISIIKYQFPNSTQIPLVFNNN